MTISAKDMVAAANEVVPRISAKEANELVSDQEALIVDVRDGSEVAQSGKIAEAKHVSRGTIEFRAGPASSTHDDAFNTEKR